MDSASGAPARWRGRVGPRVEERPGAGVVPMAIAVEGEGARVKAMRRAKRSCRCC